jgi:hypothetical protein
MRPKLRQSLYTLSLIFVVLGLWVFLDFDGDLDFGGHYEVIQTIPVAKVISLSSAAGPRLRRCEENSDQTYCQPMNMGKLVSRETGSRDE